MIRLPALTPRCAAASAVLLAAALAATQLHAAQELRPVDRAEAAKKRGSAATMPRIIGGDPADIADSPWQVAMISALSEKGFERSGQFCGGSLIAERWVLTAAHCVPGTRPEEIDIFVGASELPNGDTKRKSGGERIGVTQIISHPDYDANSSDSDLALLQLERAPKSKVKIIPMITEDDEDLYVVPGADVRIAGWGKIAETGENTTPARLQKVDVKVVDTDACRDNYHALVSPALKVTQNMLCAGVPKGGKDSCQGDSGGPLVLETGPKQWTQIGVVSWGVGCARPKLYGVYTRVAKFHDWIEEKIRGGDTTATPKK